jgi:hypothetical protein
LHVLFGFENYRRAVGIRLQTYRRVCQHRAAGRVRKFKNNGHSGRPRSSATHGEPIEKSAPHFFTGAVQTLGDLRTKPCSDLE